MSDYQSRSAGGTDTATDTADVARQESHQLKGTAKDAASSVADTAAARGREIKGQAARHARSIASDAQRQLRGHAQQETQRAGAALSTAGDQLRALADGRVEDAGVLGEYVGAAAATVNRWADAVQDRGFDGLLDDLRTFGRRRPGMFLAGALAAGIVAGRFGRNAAQELGDDERSDRDAAALPSASSGNGEGRSRTAEVDEARERTASLVHDDGADQSLGGAVGDSEYRRRGSEGAYGPGSPPEESPDDDRDTIVGYATDDGPVVVSPGGTTADQTSTDRPVAPPRDGDDVEYRPIDVDQERSR